MSAVKGQHFDNVSPINGKVICTVAQSTAEDVELALDAAHGARFLTRSRLFSDEEAERLKQAGPPQRGDAIVNVAV